MGSLLAGIWKEWVACESYLYSLLPPLFCDVRLKLGFVPQILANATISQWFSPTSALESQLLNIYQHATMTNIYIFFYSYIVNKFLHDEQCKGSHHRNFRFWSRIMNYKQSAQIWIFVWFLYLIYMWFPHFSLIITVVIIFFFKLNAEVVGRCKIKVENTV